MSLWRDTLNKWQLTITKSQRLKTRKTLLLSLVVVETLLNPLVVCFQAVLYQVLKSNYKYKHLRFKYKYFSCNSQVQVLSDTNLSCLQSDQNQDHKRNYLFNVNMKASQSQKHAYAFGSQQKS